MNIYVFLSLALVAFVSASPVKPVGQQDDVDVMIVPLEAQLYDVDDGDSGFPGGFFSFNPFGNPFSGFMQSMDDMLRSLREQMTQVLSRLPEDNTEWKEIADGKKNTTSTTKVINGHKVTINETTYANEGDNSGTFFKIRVVDVHPTSEEDSDNSDEKVTIPPNTLENSDEQTTKTPNASENKEVEEITTKPIDEDIERGSPEIQDSANEIPRGTPKEENSLESEIETLGEDFDADVFPDESLQSLKLSNPEIITSDIEDFADSVKEIESNDVNSHIYDLSNDILVNQMMKDAGAPHNPDAELIGDEFFNDQPRVQSYSTQRVVPLLGAPSYPYPMWPVYYDSKRP